MLDRSEELKAVFAQYGEPATKPTGMGGNQSQAPQNYESDASYLKIGLARDSVFAALWNGEKFTGDESADDQSLFNKLVYWCNHNIKLIREAAFDSPFYKLKDAAHKRKWERKDYLARTIKKAIEGTPITARDKNDAFNAKQFTHSNNIPDLSAYSVVDLQMKEIPPLRWIVEKYLPQGLGMLASPPKYGKSWFVLDLCLSVSAGAKFFNRNTGKGDCLYLALEDSDRRLKDRVNKVTQKTFAPAGFYYSTTAQTLKTGLIEQLERFISEHPDTALIVIDTLQKIRDISTSAKETAYATDYREAGALKTLADKYNISVLIVHHLRKMSDDSDPYNRISGTSGLLGSMDTAMVLTKERRTSDEAKLSITGRDVEEVDIILSFNKEIYRWDIKGTAEEIEERRLALEYEDDPIIQTVKYLLEENPDGWEGTMSELLNACREVTDDCPYERSNELGKKMTSYAGMLWLRDKIKCNFPDKNGGKKGRKYHFSKKK